MAPLLWTIGHSNHRIEHLLGLLSAERIELVADVRSQPRSRRHPQFNRERLQGEVEGAGMRYEFLGGALGGRPSSERQLDANGHALYGAMAREPAFGAAIERLLEAAKRHRIALLCSEGDPRDCHRRLLVGRVLTERGAELRHIGRDGGVVVERSVMVEPAALFGTGGERWRSTRPVPGRGVDPGRGRSSSQ